jgi:hypothetical protein
MWKNTPDELHRALSAPFPNSDIEWRVSATTQDKSRGLAVPYVTNRAIQNRLDNTVGVDGWHNDFVPWKGESAQLCGISIYFPELQAWITKWDGADDSDIESVKGGLSDSMKRAAVEWSIGRYLYGMTQVWVAIEQRGKGYVIRDSERPSLDAAHERWVQTLQQRRSGTGVAPQQGNVSPGTNIQPQTQQQVPAQPSSVQQSAPVQAQTPLPPSGQQPSAERPAIRPQAQSQQPAGSIPEGCYLVTGAVLKPTMGGTSRTSLQLRNGAGQVLQAYTRDADNRLAPGTMLTGAQFTTKHSNGVTFYVLEEYHIMDCGPAQAA